MDELEEEDVGGGGGRTPYSGWTSLLGRVGENTRGFLSGRLGKGPWSGWMSCTVPGSGPQAGGVPSLRVESSGASTAKDVT